jgi:hypothetical protein
VVKPHLLAQHAVVRMLFDAAFAAQVRAAPDDTLPHLPSELRHQLAAIDERALRLDRLRGRRLLRTLFDEFKASTTLVLAQRRQLAFLDQFFASPFFATVLQGNPLYCAFAEFLMRDHDRDVANVVSIELGIARSRRRREAERDGRVWRAPGVEPVRTTRGGLAALQQAEQYLFEVGLMPAVALCDDAPTLLLDERARDATPLWLVIVPTQTGQTLVTIDEPLYQQLSVLPQPYSPSLQPLVDDEIAVRT